MGRLAVDVGVVEECAGLGVAEVDGLAEADAAVIDGHDDAAGVVEGAGEVHVSEAFEQRGLQGVAARLVRGDLLEEGDVAQDGPEWSCVEDETGLDGAVVDGEYPAEVELTGGGEDVSPLHPAVEGGHNIFVEVVEGLVGEAGVIEEPGEGVDGGAVFLNFGGSAVAGALGLVLKDGVEVGDDTGSAVDGLAGGADVGEGGAEDVGGAVELALEQRAGGEERGDGGGVVVEEGGHDVGVDGPEGLGDGELPPAVGDGEDDGFLRNGYESAAEGHVVIFDRRTGETVGLRYYFF